MSKAAFMGLEKLKGVGIWQKAARHNRRGIQAELGASGHIDATRSHLNMTLMGPPTPEDVAKMAKAKMTAAGITKDRKNGVLGVELVFSLPTNHQQDVIAYFTACAHWAGAAFGGLDNIISVDIHRDEAKDHAHVLLVPLFDGRLRGSDAVGNKRKLIELQANFFKNVASKFGFSKPRSKLSGNHEAQITRLVLGKMLNDPAAKSAAWPVIRKTIERDPLPYALELGINTDTPAKPAKTMAQIFTGTGKGRKKENPIANHTNKPYRVSTPSDMQTLGHCRVSISPPPPKAPPVPEIKNTEVTSLNYRAINKPPLVVESIRHNQAHTEPSFNKDQFVRIRDSAFMTENYDPETGEFYSPSPKKISAKHEANKWIGEALNSHYPPNKLIT